MTFGQLVIGQPGAGKSTYCRAAALALGSLYGRRCAIVNLDPANDDRHNAVDDTSDNSSFSGPAAISIHDLISLQDAMDAYGLGPNGGIMYCMEYLAANLDWLDARLAQVSVSDDGQGQQVYLLIDLPGQVELYAHHDAVRTVVSHLVRNGYRLCVTQLTDSSHLLDPYKSISSMLLSLQSMLHLELPHIHVLSKLDLTAAQSPPPRFFATASDPSRAAALLAANPTTPARYAKLAAALAEFVDDYSLVSYLPLCATDPACLRAVCAAADRAVGY
ncbi:GPN-loop GTPase, partial [Blastocladiella britannica]